MGWPLQEVLGVPWCMVTCEKGVLGMAGGTGVLEGGRPGDGDWRGSGEGKVYFGGWREGCGGKVYWVYWGRGWRRGGGGVFCPGVSSGHLARRVVGSAGRYVLMRETRVGTLLYSRAVLRGSWAVLCSHGFPSVVVVGRCLVAYGIWGGCVGWS